jgi:hypothetical protein
MNFRVHTQTDRVIWFLPLRSGSPRGSTRNREVNVERNGVHRAHVVLQHLLTPLTFS